MSKRHSKWYIAAGALLVLVGVLLCISTGRHGVLEGGARLPVGHGTPRLALGNSHGVVLASDGSLWTWGEAEFGWNVLGLGSTVRTQACLRRIGRESNWVDVAAGGATSLALKADGTVWAWGENIYGQLGDGTRVQERAAPVRSVPGNDWKQVATAGPHSLALKRDGSLWSWGNNWAGQLGDGSTNFSLAPARVGASTNWTRVWANLIQNVAQQTDGSLWFWGWDYTRSEKGSSTPLPTRVSADTNWVDVGMGDWMVFAIKSDGTLWAWGRQAHLYTGAAHPEEDSSPLRVGTDSDWRACAAFAQATPMFLKRDGSLWILDASARRGYAVVTALVSGLITNGELHFAAESPVLGGDPAFGVLKSLEISYQLGGTNRVMTFAEHAAVDLGGPGQTLTITRAIYGNRRLFGDAARLGAQATNSPPARFRRIELPRGKEVVAFCAGRHQVGAVLTADGEVWTWGDAWGDNTPAIPPLQFLSHLLRQAHVQVSWGEPQRRSYEQPWVLGREN